MVSYVPNQRNELGSCYTGMAIPSNVLVRLGSLLRPNATLHELCVLIYFLVSGVESRQTCAEDMWQRVRKFLRREDLELSLMFFSVSKLSRRTFDYCKARLEALSELDVIRSGDDASSLYEFLRYHLA